MSAHEVQPTKTFQGHKEAVRGLHLSDGRLFSASEDGVAKAFTLSSGACTRNFIGHKEWVGSVVHVCHTTRFSTTTLNDVKNCIYCPNPSENEG